MVNSLPFCWGLPWPPASSFPLSLWYAAPAGGLSLEPRWVRLPGEGTESMWCSPGTAFATHWGTGSRGQGLTPVMKWAHCTCGIFTGKKIFFCVRPITRSTSRVTYSKQAVTSLRFSLGLLLHWCLYYFEYLYKNISDIFAYIHTWRGDVSNWTMKTNKSPPVVIISNWLGMWR